MKRISITVILSILFICGCSFFQKEDVMEDTDKIIQLSNDKVERFINVLPVVFDFSKRYYQGLPEYEKDKPGAENKFFNSLMESEKVGRSLKENGFEDFKEFVAIYRNVMTVYVKLESELYSNENFYESVKELKNMIDSNRNVLNARLNDSNLTEEKRNEILSNLDNVRDNEIFLSNIMIVKSHQNEIRNINKIYSE